MRTVSLVTSGLALVASSAATAIAQTPDSMVPVVPAITLAPRPRANPAVTRPPDTVATPARHDPRRPERLASQGRVAGFFVAETSCPALTPASGTASPAVRAYAARLRGQADSAYFVFLNATGTVTDRLRWQLHTRAHDAVLRASLDADEAYPTISRLARDFDIEQSPARYTVPHRQLRDALDALSTSTHAFALALRLCFLQEQNVTKCDDAITSTLEVVESAEDAYGASRHRVACLLRSERIRVDSLPLNR